MGTQAVVTPVARATQAEEQPYVHVLSCTGTSVQVAFHATDVQRLAEVHPVVAALLRAARRPRNGCYRAATADLVAEADVPPYLVRLRPSRAATAPAASHLPACHGKPSLSAGQC